MTFSRLLEIYAENRRFRLALNPLPKGCRQFVVGQRIQNREQLCLKSSRNRLDVGLPADTIAHHDVKDG